MENQNIVVNKSSAERLPFPAEWIHSNPGEVGAVLGRMPVADQVRCATLLKGKDRLDLILLSPKGVEVARALPPEEIYHMVKEMGGRDMLPILSAISEGQLQYIFDLEWWQEDKFLPQRAVDWFALLDQCDDPQILNWFLTEEFEQKVMVLQALVKVCKRDEMTDRYEGTDDLIHLTLDGVYDIYFKVPEAEPALKKALKLLREGHERVYFALLEAAIWYPVTPTVENAYQWRLARTAERGIPEFDEAMSVYSRLDPEVLKIETAAPEDFSDGGRYPVAPRYPIDSADPATFLGQCLAMLADERRFETIRWELVYLANKVMVADRRDPAAPKAQAEVLRKVLGYVNIGLELGTEGDIRKGEKLLERAWLQSLFQVGYGRAMQLKWQAETLIKEEGAFLWRILTAAEQAQCVALADRFPKVSGFAGKGRSYDGRDPESLEDVRQAEKFLYRARFLGRFFKNCLGLNENDLTRILEKTDYPENKEAADYVALTTTALARHALFKEISCEPLPDVAAKSFLQIIFIRRIFKDDPAECDQRPIDLFREKLLSIPMAWSDDDKALLAGLVRETELNLKDQFGGIDLAAPVEWRYTRGLLITKSSSGPD